MAARCLGPDLTALPVLLSSPHSGRIYPDWFFESAALGPAALHPLDDGPTDLFVEEAVAQGAGAVCALYPRAVVDLNRSAHEIDPDLLSPGSRRRIEATARVRAGLGVIPTRAGYARIYPKGLGDAALTRRLALAYEPYHAILERRLDALAAGHGQALLLDVHSMPDVLASAHGRRIDVALGDRFGCACKGEVVAAARACLAGQGFAVAVNQPYAGGHITERYGRPNRGVQALQVEVRRGLFLDETGRRVRPESVERLNAALARLTLLLADVLVPRRVRVAA